MLPGVFAAGLLLALGQTQWEAGLRTELRGYDDGAGDLVLVPDLAIEDRSRDLLLRARYDPQLLFREPRPRDTFGAAHRDELTAAFRLDRDLSLTLIQSGSVGPSDMSWVSLDPSAAPFLGVVSYRSPLVTFINETVSAKIEGRVSRQLSLNATAGFGITGGLGQQVTTYPRTDAVSASAGATWTERRDTFTLGANGSYGWVTGGYDTMFYGGSVAWRHAYTLASERTLTASAVDVPDETLGPRYETELRAGFAGLGGNTPYQQSGVIPTGEASLFREAPRRPGALAARVTLRYAPVIDPLTGAFIARGELSAKLDLWLDRHFAATATGGLGYAPQPGPNYPKTLGQEGLALTYEPSPGIAFSAGGRVAHIPQTEWAGIVTASFQQRGRL